MSIIIEQLFTEARTHSAWQEKSVPQTLLQQLYDVMKFGATSVNCCPLRIVFLTTEAAKQRLKPHLDAGNIDKTMTAPVVAILAQDNAFYEKLPQLFPHLDAKSWFVGNASFAHSTAFRNSTLQGAYFMLAARALGLDCGPMSGFNADGVNEEFFKGTNLAANFLCNVGYGDASKVHPRLPRLSFSDACTVL